MNRLFAQFVTKPFRTKVICSQRQSTCTHMTLALILYPDLDILKMYLCTKKNVGQSIQNVRCRT